ncbi:hypothetical protein BX666DRAFT_360181 [Dichotomocladium elegans]|nr:hypothetical protein BX666DRAFT_360181 [Dichotomocladium elegans]
MSSSLADVTHYTLSTHPRNPSIIELREKATENLAYIKIRHKIPEGYSISLVNPSTFVPFAESQSKNAAARSRSIVLREGAVGPNSKAVEVMFNDSSFFGFEWAFEWENQRYRW